MSKPSKSTPRRAGQSRMPKFKIGLVLDDSLGSDNGGVQQYVLTLGAWLTGRGHSVHYLVGETERRDLANLHSLARNVAVRYNHNRLSLPLPADKSAIRSLLKAEKFDILHVQMPYSPMLGARIIKLAPARTAIIGTFHILPYSTFTGFANRLLGLAERRSLAKFSQVIAVSPAAQDFAKRAYGLSSEVIGNAVATGRFAAAKPIYKKSQRLSIVFLGRLVPRKGCQVLLEAVKLLTRKSNLPEFEVVICGDGPLRPSLENFVSDNNLSKIVKFLGYLDEADKPARLASADISVFPSKSGESFGIVLVEAMASGLAVVLAGNNPGYASVLEGNSELLFDPRSPSELAAKLELYLLDAHRRQLDAAWCRRRAAQFDIDHIGPQIEAIYFAQVATGRKT